MTRNLPFVGVVLNGGRSERMGTNKANLLLDGKTLLELSALKLKEASASSILIVGNALIEEFEIEATVIKDRWPNEGPLGGILTALQFLQGTDLPVVIVACDFPELDTEEIRNLVKHAHLNKDSIIVPRVGEINQWMHACWPISAEEHIRKSFLNGERAPHRAVSGHEIVVLDRKKESAYFDVDTPEDFEKVKMR
ncbi:MAG: molybdenum cofactor guanylyltransferase [Acidimicrobiales bacterium]|nr:molybdenum cofactor guanylyltransferase [Acidimicrobiales bacterium]